MHNRLLAYNRNRIKVAICEADYVFEDTESICCVPLTQAQIRMLISILEPQKWQTRWYGNVPSVDYLDEFISDLEARLLVSEC